MLSPARMSFSRKLTSAGSDPDSALTLTLYGLASVCGSAHASSEPLPVREPLRLVAGGNQISGCIPGEFSQYSDVASLGLSACEDGSE